MATESWIPTAGSGGSTGYIQKQGLTYNGVQANNPLVQANTGTGLFTRAYMNFQTANTLPPRAIIENVEFLLRISSSSVGTAPSDWRWTFDIGQNIIQDAITTNENAIWNNSGWVECWEEDFAASPTDTDIDLGVNGIKYFNTKGDTEICIRDTSLWFLGQSWTYSFAAATGHTYCYHFLNLTCE